MKKLFIWLIFLSTFSIHLLAQSGPVTQGLTSSASTCTPSAPGTACLFLPIGATTNTVAVTIGTSTFSGTVQFEVSGDGATWSSVSATPSGGGSSVTSATASGTWQIQAGGYLYVRVRCSTYASGTIVVTLNPSKATTSSSGGGSGSGTVASCSTAGAFFYAASTGTTATCDANLTDLSSTLTYTGSNGIALTTGGNTGDIKLSGTSLHLGGGGGSGPVQTDGPLYITYFVNLIGSGIYDANSSFGNAGAILTPAASGAGASGTGVAWTTQAAFTNAGATLTLGSVGGNTGALTLLGTTSGSVAWTCNPTTTCGTMQTSALVSMGKASSGAFVSNGTKFTTNQGCGENTSSNLVGGASAGTITTAGSTSCTTIVTIGGSLSSSNGWSCTVIDLTTAGDLTNPHQTASSTTTATFVTGTIVSGDKLQFSCVGY